MSSLHRLRDRLWRSRIVRGLALLATPPGPRRSDATSVPLGYGSGGKVEGARPTRMLHLSDEELVDLSSYGIGRRLTWGFAAGALRAPWELPDGLALPPIEGLDWQDLLVEATATARSLGGAHLWPVTDDDPETWREPLPPGSHEIRAVHVLSALDARPRLYEASPASQHWTRPATWDVHPMRQEVATRSWQIHASRLIYIPGLPAMGSQRVPRRGYDLSALDAYWPALRRIELALESATIGAVELSTPWVRMGSPDPMSGEDALSADERLDLMQAYRSMARLSVLFGDDTLGRDNVALTGLRTEVLLALYEAVCSVEGMSLTAVFGQSPAGLSSVDEAGRRNDAAALDAIRRGCATPAIQRLVEIATGRTVEVEWSPLDVDDPAQSAQLVAAGIADPDELRARHGLAPRDVGEPVEASEEDIARVAELMRVDAETYTPPESAQRAAGPVIP